MSRPAAADNRRPGVTLGIGVFDSMNKGYAVGFLIILLVLGLGMYVAYTSFVSSREAWQAQRTTPANTRVEHLVQPSSTPLPPLSLTPTVGLTVTVPITVSVVTSTPPATVQAPPATEPPAPAPTQPTPALLPTNTPAPQAPPPTPAPAVTYQFRLAGPPAGDPNYIPGSGLCYLFGTVRDAAGGGLEGVQVQALNEWNTLSPATSKAGAEAGHYDIPISCDKVTWYVVVLDGAGEQISTKVQVPFDPNVANSFRIDWQRTY